MDERSKERVRRLRDLAKAATPGPWRNDGYEQWSNVLANGEGIFGSDHTVGEIQRGEDAAFITAASPQMILFLLEVFEEADACGSCCRCMPNPP